MPELVRDGPDIPPHLMNELDDGRVVFFCGAGVSKGPESDLPNFEELVSDVYDRCGRERPDPKERPLELDRELDLLEQRLVAGEVRKAVVERLSREPPGELVVHQALIDLSRTTKGWRLVTTNFDNRFEEAGLKGGFINVAPRLPVPKPHNWSTLVHLHGRIPSDSDGPNGDGSDLVLTSADFGRAYLVERWAARFVTELFRHFTVVFVGYGLSDPVMRYLMDALDAERRLGGRIQRAYAFADSASEAKKPWRSKNVEPIVYDDVDGHRLLRETLVEWARLRTDHRARSRIVLAGVGKLVSPIGDSDVARVTWALADPDAARALADAAPINEEQDFSKIAAWLTEFYKAGLLGRVNADTAHDNSPRVQLVDGGALSQGPLGVDTVTANLARWVARHLHVPQVLAWVVGRGGHLHPVLRREIRSSLARPEMPIPPRLRHLWTVLVETTAREPFRFVYQEDQFNAARSESEKRRLEEAVLQALRPRLRVHPGPSNYLRILSWTDNETTPMSSLWACGHLRLEVGDADTRREARRLFADRAALARHAERLTRYLEDAIVLLRDDDTVPSDDGGEPRFYYRYWVATDSDPDFDKWTYLIDLVRDSYMALAKFDHGRASLLLARWAASEHWLLRRIALHAITEDESADIRLVEGLLLGGPEPSIWRPELRNEVLRLLNKSGSRLPEHLCARIIEAVHAGPIGGSTADGDPAGVIRDAKIGFLAELRNAGVELDRESDLLLADTELRGGDFDLRYRVHSSRRAEVVDVQSSVPVQLTEAGIDELAEVLASDSSDATQVDGLVVRAPTKVARALRRLSKRDLWPLEAWRRLLWHLSSMRGQKEPMIRLENYTARVLLEAPKRLFRDVGTAVSGLVRGIAEHWIRDRESEYSRLWKRAWLNACQDSGLDDQDPVTRALNQVAGILAEAAMLRMWQYQPKVGGELPEAVRPYFGTIASDPCGHLGRVMLASRLNALYVIDPLWTDENLVPLLDPSSGEAYGLWAGFAWSPTAGPNLLEAFKQPYLSVLKLEELPQRTARALVRLLIAISLDHPSGLTQEEIRSVVQTLPISSLVVVLRSLERRLTGTPEERKQAWNGKVQPWLDKYWPREDESNSGATSEAMIHLAIESGAAFPDVVSRCRPFLKSIRGHSLYSLHQSTHGQDYPNVVLELLDSVIQRDVLEVWARRTLGNLLDDLSARMPDIASDLRFKALRRVAQS